jgi:hypothetical protein
MSFSLIVRVIHYRSSSFALLCNIRRSFLCFSIIDLLSRHLLLLIFIMNFLLTPLYSDQIASSKFRSLDTIQYHSRSVSFILALAFVSLVILFSLFFFYFPEISMQSNPEPSTINFTLDSRNLNIRSLIKAPLTMLLLLNCLTLKIFMSLHSLKLGYLRILLQYKISMLLLTVSPSFAHVFLFLIHIHLPLLAAARHSLFETLLLLQLRSNPS